MYILSNDKVLPEIFSETGVLFDKVYKDLVSFKESLLLENQTLNVKSFFEKYSKYQTRGLQILKASIGDLCVGLKALGNKFGSLEGSSFEKLSKTSENVITVTGEFIDFTNNFVISSEQIMQEDQKNVDLFEELCDNYQKYFLSLNSYFKELSTCTLHLYGDAKNRLQENFNEIKTSLVSFIHMVKIKIVSALANIFVGIQLGYEYFSDLSQIKFEDIYNEKLIDENDEIIIDNVNKLLETIIVNFEEALTQSKKYFN